MSPPLSVVADNSAEKAKSSHIGDLSERIRRLQAEAKNLAREHVRALEAAIIEVERLSSEISDGGDAYPAGVRELARRIAEDCEMKVQTLEAISSRN